MLSLCLSSDLDDILHSGVAEGLIPRALSSSSSSLTNLFISLSASDANLIALHSGLTNLQIFLQALNAGLFP